MAKGFGIAGLVIAILAIFIPGYGLHFSAGAIFFAAVAALAGDRIFATAICVIAAVNTLFMSPLLWAMVGNTKDVGMFYVVIFIFLAAPFLAMFLHTKGFMRLESKES